MFGFGWVELTILTIVLVLIYAFTKRKDQTSYAKAGDTVPCNKCMTCGYIGAMKTWCKSSFIPNLIIFVGLLFYLVPGLLFMFYAWGRLQCPQCKTLGKSRPATDNEMKEERSCPFCAETIKAEAIICRHCGKDLVKKAKTEIDISPTTGT